MNSLFTEFDNENALRDYPFASGCTGADAKGVRIDAGVIVDAALYPVNPTGRLYLSRIDTDGVVSISDDTGVVMQATRAAGAAQLEFYDTSGLHRHVGTVLAASPAALESFVNVYEVRRFTAEGAAFASSCVFPVVNDGVTSLDVAGTGPADGEVAFANGSADEVRVSTDADGGTLRFDVLPSKAPVELSSIRHVYCIVDGKTPFRVMKIPFALEAHGPGNTVAVYLAGIDRQDICANAHREDALETRDTCDCGGSDSPCGPDIDPPEDVPSTYQTEVVDMDNGAENAFYLAVPNMTGYDNPLSITLEDGVTVPVLALPDDAAEDAFVSRVDAKGVVFQVPGMEPT